MQITAKMVKDLRESTGAGMMDCKKALVEANGDMEQAIKVLHEKGLGKAAKKAEGDYLKNQVKSQDLLFKKSGLKIYNQRNKL